MVKVSLTFPTPEGSQEIPLDGERLSLGRGSEAGYRFSDDGLSRLHATLYCDGNRVWIVDENSSNGTFVNGSPVRPGGTPLQNGDTIRIGHKTSLKVRMAEALDTKPNSAQTGFMAAPQKSRKSTKVLVPATIIGAAVLVFAVSVIFVGFKVFGSKRDEIVRNDEVVDEFEDNKPARTKEQRSSSTPKSEAVATKEETIAPEITADPPTTDEQSRPTVSMPQGKKYLDLSDSERRQYLADRSMRIAQIIGNRSSDPIPPAALDKIKVFTDAYAKRINVKPRGGCGFSDNLQATYERASKNAPFIVRAFHEKGTDPRIGLYLAMIESEHCVCLQSPTGPLGMFQFTYATAKLHFQPNDGVIKGASPSKPDLRCQPEPAARAAASYMKALTARYGTGPASVPLAIGSYNSGEGGLSSNLVKALESNTGLPRDFWTLIANGEKLSKQFQSENFKYVPKFFAAAIVGENPQDFGLTLQPISTYTK